MILKGLGYYIKTEEIQAELFENHQIVASVRRITSKAQRDNNRIGSVFSITVKPGEVEALTNIEFLCHHKATWELPYRRQNFQCPNCMRPFHSGGGCAYATRCGHCGGNHSSKECPNPDNMKCALCNEEGHKALDPTCPSRLGLDKEKEKQKEEKEKNRLWQMEKTKRAQQAALQTIREGVSFRDALHNPTKQRPPTAAASSTAAPTPTTDFGSFLEDTAEELFGIPYTEYFNKVKAFKDYFYSIPT